MEKNDGITDVGEMKDADGVGEVGNPICGDMMTIYIKVKDDYIDDISFLTFGCGAAIAVSSILTEMAKGKTIDEAQKITNKAVAAALEGLPKNKLHCSNLGADALQLAIRDYLDKKAGIVREGPKRSDKHEHSHGDVCYCPLVARNPSIMRSKGLHLPMQKRGNISSPQT